MFLSSTSALCSLGKRKSLRVIQQPTRYSEPAESEDDGEDHRKSRRKSSGKRSRKSDSDHECEDEVLGEEDEVKLTEKSSSSSSSSSKVRVSKSNGEGNLFFATAVSNNMYKIDLSLMNSLFNFFCGNSYCRKKSSD